MNIFPQFLIGLLMHVKNSNPLSHEYGYGSMGLKRIDLMNNNTERDCVKFIKLVD